MNFTALFEAGNFLFLLAFFVLEVFLLLWVLKVSAQWAYGKKVSYTQAGIQLLAIIFIQILLFIVFSSLLALIG